MRRSASIHRIARRSLRAAVLSLLAVFITPCHMAVSAERDTPSASRLPSSLSAVTNVTFVVFDTETTGFSSRTDRIVEIGAVKFRGGKVIEKKSWLVNPQRKIPYWVQKIHGISNETVSDKPPFSQVYPEFEDFIRGSVLMAHNARFDVAFMAAEIARAKQAVPPNPVLDSLRLFRLWYPDSASHTLSDLAEHTDISAGRFHRGLADSMHVYLIFDKGLQARAAGMRFHDLVRQCGGALRF